MMLDPIDRIRSYSPAKNAKTELNALVMYGNGEMAIKILHSPCHAAVTIFLILFQMLLVKLAAALKPVVTMPTTVETEDDTTAKTADHRLVKKPEITDQLAIINRGMPINGINTFNIGFDANTLSMPTIMLFIKLTPVWNAFLIAFHTPVKNPLIGSQFL